MPRTYTQDEVLSVTASEYPLFGKPIIGSSSTGAIKLDNRKALDCYIGQQKDVLIQGYVEGKEITVDVFCNKNSKPLVVAPRLRLSTKGGQSVKGRTIDNKEFFRPVETLCHALPHIGVCNILFKKTDNGLVLLEMNPRYAAGGLMLTVHAGANIPLLALKEMLGVKIDNAECQVKTNIVMSRYWEELFIDDKKIILDKSKGAV